jgi:hypothetical protein
MGERAADVASAHQGNLLAGHCGLPHCFAGAWVACALARGKALVALWRARAARNRHAWPVRWHRLGDWRV